MQHRHVQNLRTFKRSVLTSLVGMMLITTPSYDRMLLTAGLNVWLWLPKIMLMTVLYESHTITISTVGFHEHHHHWFHRLHHQGDGRDQQSSCLRIDALMIVAGIVEPAVTVAASTVMSFVNAIDSSAGEAALAVFEGFTAIAERFPLAGPIAGVLKDIFALYKVWV